MKPPDDGDGLDTAALRDSVIEQMRDERGKHLFIPLGTDRWACACGYQENGEWQEWADHVEDRVLARALAVTACTTCRGTGHDPNYPTSGPSPTGWVEYPVVPCPVCGGTPPRALRLTSNEPQYAQWGWYCRDHDDWYPTTKFCPVDGSSNGEPLFRVVLTERNEQEG